MKKKYINIAKFVLCFIVGLISENGYSQNEKQVKEIIKHYDLEKAKELLESFKNKEATNKKLVEEYAKRNNLPIFKESLKGGFQQLMKITPEGLPLYYSIDNAEAAISTRVPHLRSGGSLGLNLTGTGIVPRVWDGGPIHAHQEYAGRITMVDNTVRNSNSFHAIHVTGTIIGSGVTAAAKGMAPTATARTFDWDADESEAISEAMNGMLLSNHSYGVPVGSVAQNNLLPAWFIGSYVDESYNWDVITHNFPYYLPVISAGNDGNNNGNATPTTAGYDKLVGNKNSKNVLTIANSLDATVNAAGVITAGGNVHSSSSQGPSDDMRIKPDVAGDGAGTGGGIFSAGNGSGDGGLITDYTNMLGTSMAAPNVTGTLALVQQHANNVSGKFLKAATLKGLVCHTATDRGRPGPDANHGWGMVDAKFAAETITNNGLSSWISEEELTQGQTIVKQFVATGGTVPLLGSICWTDVPDASKINTTSAVNDAVPDLTNDLDIRITQGASTFFPWRLTNVATANATRVGDNPVDNVERINVDAPTAAAVYTVTISHKGVLSGGSQKFALVVTGITSNFTFKTTADTQTVCSSAGNAVYPFSLTKTGGANVVMSASNVPAGAVVAFSNNNFSADGTFNVTISNLVAVANGSYVIDIIGNNGTETETRKIFLTVYHAAFSTPVYVAPADGLANVTTTATLDWADDANATSWDVEVSTSPTFIPIAFSGNTLTSTYNLVNLSSQTVYYWRVRPKNSCATPAFSTMRSFQTAIIDCTPATFNGVVTDATLEVSGSGSGTATINVTGGLTIGKITASVNITHSYVEDLTIRLTGPAAIGSPVVIMQQEACGDQNNINCTYDDAGNAPACSAVSPAISGNIRSFQTLGNLDGLLANGTWTISISDPYNGDGGTFNSASLKICNKTAIAPVPTLISNAIDVVATSTSVITSADMNATSTAQTDLQQTYTLLQVPGLGNLKKNGVNLNVGNTFTQKDINDGIISYINSEITASSTTFKVDVKNATNGWVPSRTITINIVPCGSVVTTWNGTAWSNGLPTKTSAVVFANTFNSTSTLEACSITVNSGVNVTVNAGHTFVVNGSISNNGNLTVMNNGAIRQIDATAVNTGNVLVRRNSTGMVRLDYTAWSSPVSGQQLQAFSPLTLPTRFYEYLFTGTTTPTAYQSVVATNNFTPGKGYMIRTANNWPTISTVYNGQFSGVLNNGNVSQSIGVGYNLIGNPYASPINARRFLTANPSVGTLYFWTHTVAAVSGVYPQNNYASFTSLGGVAAAAGGAIPNGYIQTGQGFFVNSAAAGSVSFTNSVRENAVSSNQFYKQATIENSIIEPEKHRLWLNLNDATNSYNQILVGYAENATNAVDLAIDGEVLDKSKTMIYSVLNENEFAIQGKALPFVDSDEIQLGIKIINAGNYSVSIENFDGVFTSQEIYLKDKTNNTFHNLKTAPYLFTSNEGVFNNRFSIVYRNELLQAETFNATNVVVFAKDNAMQINASENIYSVEVYDVLGKQVFAKKDINSLHFSAVSITNANQALLVKVILSNGDVVMKKIVM